MTNEIFPKFTLTFDKRHPSAPYIVRENAFIEGKLMNKPLASFRHLPDALEYFSEFTGEVMISFSQELVERT